ncbi:MAG: ATP-dependent Clp protease ATP-binding subunit, partial [Clostridia bacterium]|nr:ATP-dependent Clp protease ATP-binding subunit [Clostridia bacterium]
MTNRFTAKAQRALNAALNAASEMGHTYVGSEHILLGLCADDTSAAAGILRQRGAGADDIRRAVEEMAGVGVRTDVSPADMTPRTKKIIEASAMLASRTSCSYIGTEHLLLALLGEPDCVGARILASLGVKRDEVAQDLAALLSSSDSDEAETEEGRPGAARDKGGDASLSDMPSLKNYGRDLTAAAKEGKIDPIIGRDDETARLIQILCRRQKNNPCL